MIKQTGISKEAKIEELQAEVSRLSHLIEKEKEAERKKKVDILKSYTSEIYCYDGMDLLEAEVSPDGEILSSGWVPVKEVLKIIEKSKQTMIAVG